jgi:hypothetical protein
MHESSAPSLIPAAAQAWTADLYAARSLTLIVHGVGAATSDGLLRAASDGYIGSDLGGISRRTVLTDCPSLTGGEGADSLVIQTSGGSHFVVALPWAQRRTRLSAVAILIAGLLLILTVVMSVTFVFRGTLEWLEHWLASWTHRLVAYAVMTGFGFLVYLLRPNPTEREFQRPSMFNLLLPLLLLLGLMSFVEGTWLWIATAALVFALWLISTMIVGRCLLIAPTVGWRMALAALIVAISLPSAAIVRIARHSATRADEQYQAADSPFTSPLIHLPPGTWEALERKTHANDPAESAAPQPPTPKTSSRKAENSKPHSNQNQRSKEETEPVNRLSRPAKSVPVARDYDSLADIEASDSILNDREDSIKALSSYKPSVVDLVTGPEFVTKLTLAAVCVVLCLFVMCFHWLLDFGFDVLHYGGNEKHRTLLIESLTKSIRWFHAQAPDASIIVVGHSLGSVAAAQTIASSLACESWLSHVVLVTLGSPLNYIGRVFPKSVPPTRKLADAICAANVRWINLWRRSDPIGKFLDIGDIETVQYCVGPGGHLDYWSGGVVWKAVAFEALGIGARSPNQIIGAAEACVLERRLGVLVFASVVVLALCGVGLWNLFP